MLGNQMDRNDYDVSSSQSAQDNFDRHADALEAALDRRDQDVKTAMADYKADGVSERYEQMERKWNMAGKEVRGIIKAIRQSLAENDDIATRAVTEAGGYLPD